MTGLVARVWLIFRKGTRKLIYRITDILDSKYKYPLVSERIFVFVLNNQ